MFDLATLPIGSGLPSETEINDLSTKVERIAGAFAARMEGITTTLAKADERFAADARNEILPKSAEERAQIGPVAAHSLNATVDRVAQRRSSEYRKLVVEETEQDRTEMLRQLREAETRLSVVEHAYPSPVAMLSAQGLGSAERSRYLEQVSHAGPAELVTYASQALLRGDRLLAAAVMSRLDQLPATARPFKAADFAHRLLGDEHARLMTAVKTSRLALKRAEAADRELRLHRRDTIGKIARGLAAQQLKKIAGATS